MASKLTGEVAARAQGQPPHGTRHRDEAYLPERHEAAWNEREYAVGKIAELEAENAKLRELVDELYPLAYYGAQAMRELDRAHDLMRELGLEVG